MNNKIIHIINSLEYGGAETMLCNLLTRAGTSRFRPVVVALIDDLRVARAQRFFGRSARLPETHRISGIEAGQRKPRRDRYGSRVRKSKSLLIHGAEGRSKSRLVRPLGGGHLTAREPYRILLADIAQMVGRRPPRLRLPIAAVYPLAWGAEVFARLSGREPFATRDGLRMARIHMFYSDAKARSELGYSSRPYREGIADAISWFRQAGYLR